MHVPAALLVPGTSTCETKAELVLLLHPRAGAEAGQQRGGGAASSPYTDR